MSGVMVSRAPRAMVEEPDFELPAGRLIIRRFTDTLIGTNSLEQSLKNIQEEEIAAEVSEEEERLRELYELPARDSDNPENIQDFAVAEIARAQLQKVIDDFIAKENPDKKPTVLQRIRGPDKVSAKIKAARLLQASIQEDVDGHFDNIKTAIDELETQVEADRGSVHKWFMRVSHSIENHRSMLKVFPSQNNYTSSICGSLSCILKAAKNHSDIAELLSYNVAYIWEKVANCILCARVVKTPALKRRLASIYALMFQYFQNTLEWYMRSKWSAALASFNENQKEIFDRIDGRLEKEVEELHRLVRIGSVARQCMIQRDVEGLKAELPRMRREQRAMGGSMAHVAHSMNNMMFETLLEFRTAHAPELPPPVSRGAIEGPQAVSAPSKGGILGKDAQHFIKRLQPFVIGDEGPAFFGSREAWMVEDSVLDRLRFWMRDSGKSQTLWISSPDEGDGTMPSGSLAAAFAMVAAAWQAKAPIISHFCHRPRSVDKARGSMTMEQAGMVGLTYSLIIQLLQFHDTEEQLNIQVADLEELDGSVQSWDATLRILYNLLDSSPIPLLFCVIDGLNDLSWADGRTWVSQFLTVLLSGQKVPNVVFNILFTTTGGAYVLPKYVAVKDQEETVQNARRLLKSGTQLTKDSFR